MENKWKMIKSFVEVKCYGLQALGYSHRKSTEAFYLFPPDINIFLLQSL